MPKLKLGDYKSFKTKKKVQTQNFASVQKKVDKTFEDLRELRAKEKLVNREAAKGDKVIVKGSALLNLKKFYLPECISLHELLKLQDKKERLKYIREVIHSCEIHELFIRTAQQVWRLIGKEIQSLKRMREKMKTYLRVLTVWNERPQIYLKKIKPYQVYMPHTAPLIKLFYDKDELYSLPNSPHFLLHLSIFVLPI